ncbi:glycosyltransferase [uncultured Microbacterium sp.]|uniref:glycosyltransferase n=1 Tax=uncultured Microbacterium sp. TaxID=191216 RepID=UPI0028D6CC48|nr:glycosyltransferase [uncultured Microbacterium sp.]
MTDLIVVSLEAWDGVWRRNQHLVSRLLDRDPSLRVLFVEPPADPIHRLTHGAMPQLGYGPRQSSRCKHLWTMRPLKALPRRVDRSADKRLATQVRRAAHRLEFEHPIVWVNDPGGAALSKSTGWPTLYDITDDWLAADRPPRELARLREVERFLLEHASQVVACSPELARRKGADRPRGSAPIEVIRNAVDTAAYERPRERPRDLPPGRTAVYVGTLHTDRLDIDLCEETARELKDEASVVLVGPNALGEADTRRLRTAGVIVLGARRADYVIGYLTHGDALIVPHVITPFTESLDPLKLYEYLAAGRPIVSTAVAGFRDTDDPRIHIVDSSSGFAATVRSMLDSPSVNSPNRTVADWAERVTAMCAVLDRMSY